MMRHKNILILLLVCVLAIWFQTWFQWPHQLLGVRLDILPALVLYCALFRSWRELFLVCTAGGYLYDSFSHNPLGITTLSLLLISYVVYRYRKVILYKAVWVQTFLGFLIGVLVPLLTLLQLTGLEVAPKMGWSLLWVFSVLGMFTALASPLMVWVMEYLMHKYAEPGKGLFLKEEGKILRRES